MKSVEKTVQNLISTGMDPKTENNPYLGFTFTSFQVGLGGMAGQAGGWVGGWGPRSRR